MKDNILQNFIKTRIIIIYIVFVITSFMLVDNKWNIVMGLTCGLIFGIIKYISFSRFISSILIQVEKKPRFRGMFVKFLSLQVVNALLMLVSIKVSLYFFLGVVAGILLIPLIIVANSLTEALGLSHNNFQ